MNEYSNKIAHHFITLIGSLLLVIGGIAAFLGPIESYCYYLFSDGGRFHYEGFGFGSFMFGNITMQIWGYYIIALIFIPLGYGHLKRYLWIKKISLTLLYVWFVVGIPIIPIILFIIATNKQPTLLSMVFSCIFCLLAYTLIPVSLIKFYKSKIVKIVLNNSDKKFDFLGRYPIALLMMLILYIFYIYAFHVLLLFKGIFPFFGNWIIDFKGIILVSLSILFFVVLIIGTLNKKLWSWWAAFLYFTLFVVSLTVTLLLSNFYKIVTLLGFPTRELNALVNIPLKGFHLVILFSLPIIFTIGIISFSKKHFSA